MPHALTLGSRQAGDKAEDRFGIGCFADIARGHLLSISADFADQTHGFSLRIIPEQFQHVGKIQSRDRITSNAHARALPQSVFRELPGGLIGQRA